MKLMDERTNVELQEQIDMLETLKKRRKMLESVRSLRKSSIDRARRKSIVDVSAEIRKEKEAIKHLKTSMPENPMMDVE